MQDIKVKSARDLAKLFEEECLNGKTLNGIMELIWADRRAMLDEYKAIIATWKCKQEAGGILALIDTLDSCLVEIEKEA